VRGSVTDRWTLNSARSAISNRIGPGISKTTCVGVHTGTTLRLRLNLKLFNYTPRRRLDGEEYSSYSFSTSALDGGEWSVSRPGRALAPGKDSRYPLHRTLGGPQRLEEKSFRLRRASKLHRPVVQPIARHYTDLATRLTLPLRLEDLNIVMFVL
jgi:hypothetical protein